MGTRIRFAGCELDPAAFELRRGGQACEIEPRAFDLLLYLVRNAGRLVTKDELVAEVWRGRIVSDSALATRIKAVRKAIGDDGGQQQLIRTVHGRGYRFIGTVTSHGASGAARESVGPETAPSPEPAPMPRQEVRFCTANDGVRLAYALAGEGPPLVKPANWMTHLEYDWESPVWRHWIRELARDHTLVRYDERCNGLSDWDAADLSFDAMVRDLEAIADAAELTRFPLLGISQGCAIAVAFAARHPERVSRLILYGGYARGWAMRGSAAESSKRHALSTLIEHGWGQDNPAFRQVFTTLFVPGATQEQARWFNDLQRMSASPRNAARLHESFGGIEVRELLPRVRAPTLVLHARHDAAVPFEEGRALATGIPGASFISLESENHILLETEPAWPRFLSEVRAFLATDNA